VGKTFVSGITGRVVASTLFLGGLRRRSIVGATLANFCYCSEIIRSYLGTQLHIHRATRKSFKGSYVKMMLRKIQIRANMLLPRALE